MHILQHNAFSLVFRGLIKLERTVATETTKSVFSQANRLRMTMNMSLHHMQSSELYKVVRQENGMMDTLN